MLHTTIMCSGGGCSPQLQLFNTIPELVQMQAHFCGCHKRHSPDFVKGYFISERKLYIQVNTGWPCGMIHDNHQGDLGKVCYLCLMMGRKRSP